MSKCSSVSGKDLSDQNDQQVLNFKLTFDTLVDKQDAQRNTPGQIEQTENSKQFKSANIYKETIQKAVAPPKNLIFEEQSKNSDDDEEVVIIERSSKDEDKREKKLGQIEPKQIVPEITRNHIIPRKAPTRGQVQSNLKLNLLSKESSSNVNVNVNEVEFEI